MRISAKAEYACLAMIELAATGDGAVPRRIREIAEAQGIPERYLVQILLQLKAAGFVHSARGAEGGYLLSKPPSSITLADVISAIEGPGEPVRKTPSEAGRQLGELIERAKNAQRDVLASETVASLAGRAPPLDWVL